MDPVGQEEYKVPIQGKKTGMQGWFNIAALGTAVRDLHCPTEQSFAYVLGTKKDFNNIQHPSLVF